MTLNSTLQLTNTPAHQELQMMDDLFIGATSGGLGM